jgi:hypothetical protein
MDCGDSSATSPPGRDRQAFLRQGFAGPCYNVLRISIAPRKVMRSQRYQPADFFLMCVTEHTLALPCETVGLESVCLQPCVASKNALSLNGNSASVAKSHRLGFANPHPQVHYGASVRRNAIDAAPLAVRGTALCTDSERTRNAPHEYVCFSPMARPGRDSGNAFAPNRLVETNL